ncbi:hypothetical protein TrLO_g12549 [Triparma laevis f. longispina]|uniref:tRNA pseudouridine synthase n=1 Tax=Triparma laevis f. longispina TaxID=1714387 RepID=A0A9W7DVS7_9STRA|nr:hypothetical protein TrLO_g12549 [Triparma laevis f. longispina]
MPSNPTLLLLIILLSIPSSTSLSHYLVILRYTGSQFHGVQLNPPQRTVLSVLNEDLKGLCTNFKIASRTDKGVNALGQCCTFDSEVDDSALNVAVLNERLPEDLRVTSLKIVNDNFNVHASKWKRYRYRLTSKDDDLNMSVFRKCASHANRGSNESRKKIKHFKELDVESMHRAASYIVGSHDFAKFQAKNSDKKTSQRTITRCDVEVNDASIEMVIEGNGFLYKMVRILAGSILTVGLGFGEAEGVKEVLEGGEGRVGPTMPPERLCLEHIEYDEFT